MISVYCDGSSHSRGGKPGGWGYVVVDGERILADGSGSHPSTTNNIQELTAILEGLTHLAVIAPEGLVEVVSDSQYALGMATGSFTATKNVELAADVALVYAWFGPRIRARWVKGHAGNRFNEYVDRLAGRAKEQLVEVLSAEARRHDKAGHPDRPTAEGG